MAVAKESIEGCLVYVQSRRADIVGIERIGVAVHIPVVAQAGLVIASFAVDNGDCARISVPIRLACIPLIIVGLIVFHGHFLLGNGAVLAHIERHLVESLAHRARYVGLRIGQGVAYRYVFICSRVHNHDGCILQTVGRLGHQKLARELEHDGICTARDERPEAVVVKTERSGNALTRVCCRVYGQFYFPYGNGRRQFVLSVPRHKGDIGRFVGQMERIGIAYLCGKSGAAVAVLAYMRGIVGMGLRLVCGYRDLVAAHGVGAREAHGIGRTVETAVIKELGRRLYTRDIVAAVLHKVGSVVNPELVIRRPREVKLAAVICARGARRSLFCLCCGGFGDENSLILLRFATGVPAVVGTL